MDLDSNNAYPTPFANTTIMPILLMALVQQKNAPDTASTFSEEYDYIIVGAGSAGSVVASRISEVECVSVLLLEAGKSPPLINDVPALSRNFWFTDLDWAYKTVPQKNTGRALVNNQVIWPSGKALGGSSIINGMLYVRGNKNDYNNWARNGAVGWSASDVWPYFLKLEDNADPEYLADGYHVVDGPMSVEKPGYLADIKEPIFEAAKGIGYKVLDVNGKNQTGFYDVQGTLRRGQRCSTAKAYLVPAENRTNLDILPNAFVRKILIENKRATGVQFEYKGKTQEVRARKEVILSAGTTNSAQLLMLSGIGPKKHLNKLNIPVKADLPVGDNFHDHCGSPLGFELDSRFPSILQKALDPQTFAEYVQNKTGLLSSTEGVSVTSFLNKQIYPEKDIPNYQMYYIEVPQDIVHFQLGLQPKVYEAVYAPYANSSIFFCVAQMLQPKSRGTVRLNSTDPHDPPLIDPNYFADPNDIKDVVEGLKTCQKISASSELQKLGTKPFATKMTGCEKFTDNDEYLECLVRSVVITFSHPVGTAKMGNPKDPSTVVDPRLKVKGVQGLRVVDASIMPTVPFANTNIPTIMIAEKASDMIKDTLNCKTQIPFKSEN